MAKKNKGGLVSGFVVGSIIGGVGAYIFAPKIKELQEKIVDQVQESEFDSEDYSFSTFIDYVKDNTQNLIADCNIKKQNRKKQAVSFIEAFEDETQSIAKALDTTDIVDIEFSAEELFPDSTEK